VLKTGWRVMNPEIIPGSGTHIVKFKHWKTGEILEVKGEIPTTLNNPKSDRIVILNSKGWYEDIIKNTIVSVCRCP